MIPAMRQSRRSRGQESLPILARGGPLRVKRFTLNARLALPLLTQQPTFFCAALSDAPGHVWTAPSWQGESSRRRLGSVQPCVRPFDAVRMTAGHNTLRGSGPGHKLAFENAVARVGCPDRRIDRLCITCCSPSQPSHHAMGTRRDLVRPAARQDNCIARP